MRRALSLLVTLALAVCAAAQDTHTAVIDVRRDVTPLSDGTPVAGALVAVVLPGAGPAEHSASAVSTDAEGRVVLGDLRGGVTVLVFGDGLAPVAQYVRAPSGAEPTASTIVAETAAAASVRVVDPANRPVAGAEVRLALVVDVLGRPPADRSRHSFALTARTDASGRAAFTDLPRGAAADATARADDWVPGASAPLRIGDTAEPVIVLRRGGRIAGRARQVPGGAPAPGVTLVLGGARAVTAADGSFELRGIAASGATLVVEGEEYVLRDPPRFAPTEGESRQGVLVTLTRAARLTGEVRGPGGESLGGAEIRIEWPPRDDGRPDVVTQSADEDGGFHLRGLVPADGVRVEARFAGFAPGVLTGISLPPGEDAGPLRIVLAEGGRVAGRIVAGGARGVGAVTIAARPQGVGRGLPPVASAESDAEGVFVLLGLPAEPVELWAEPPESENLRPRRFGPFVGTIGQPAPVGDLSLRTGYELTVIVAGAPVGTVVAAVDSDGTARRREVDADGAAILSGLAPGRAHVTAAAPGAPSLAQADVVLPASLPVTLGITEVGELEFRATGPAMRAVTRLDVRVEPADDVGSYGVDAPRPAVSTLSLSDPDGRFAMTVARGRHRLALRAGPLHAALDLVVGAGVQDLGVIAMERGESVRGEVMSSLGGGVEGASILVEPANDAGWPALETSAGAAGRFAVEGVPSGVARVVVTAPGHAPYVSRPIAVREGAGVDLGVVRLVPGMLVRGLVTGASGVPAGGRAVALVLDAGFRFSTETDSLGRYELPGVSAGGAVVEAADRRVRIDVPPWGREFVLDIDLGAGTRLIGRVLRDRVPQAFAGIVAWGGENGRVEVAARADATGVFELPPLPAGPITIEVTPLEGLPHVIDDRLADVSEETREFELPATRLRGAVRDGPDGAPVAGAAVRLWELNAENVRLRDAGSAVSAPNGQFEMLGPPAGRYEIEVHATGRGPGISRPFDLRDGEPLVGIDVILSAGARLRARLVDTAGRALPGGWLSALPLDIAGPSLRLRARADTGGHVALEGVLPGRTLIEAGAGGRGRKALGEFGLADGDDLDLGDVELPLAGALRVLAVHAGFLPAAGVEIEIADLLGNDPRGAPAVGGLGSASDPTRFTGVDGVLLLPDLAPGRYRVHEAGQEASVLVDVRAGEVREILLFAAR